MLGVKSWAKLSTVVLVAAALLAGGTVPVAAASRADRCHCPLMAKLGLAPCAAGGALSAPMDCCRRGAVPPVSDSSDTVLPQPLVTQAIPGGAACDAVATVERAELPGEASAARHRLGLFTLHSIWRI